jgi:hypothetical protein
MGITAPQAECGDLGLRSPNTLTEILTEGDALFCKTLQSHREES